MDDLLEEFIAETRDTLEVLSAQLLQWERNPHDLTLIDSVFRFVHTVKGSCGFLDLPRLLRLSHAAEDLLSHARMGQVKASEGLVSSVLAVIDQISALTDALETGRPVQDVDAKLIDAMMAFAPEQDAEYAESSGFEHDDIATFDAGDINSQTKARTVRVSLNLLDKLMNGVSDMVLARNDVSRHLRKHSANSDIENSFQRLSSSVAEMRDAVGMMRMQNIDRLFSSLPRLLRDINQELGKQIELTIEGSEVEVDREMVEILRDPLLHILRNSADHGIEHANERRNAGKNPVGHIKVSARQSGNQIIVEVSDDGRGIDLEKLRNKSIAAKLITQENWEKLSEKAQLEMIFRPGVSTANEISSISGRGVGMDVVHSNLQTIGGSIELDNNAGHGLKMIMRLPLTLSIIAGLSIRVGDQIFGLSRSSVVEILSSSNKNVVIEEIGGTKIAKIRGERLPYAKIEEVLHIENESNDENLSRTLIVIRPAVGSIFVMDVASVIDNEELVVKPGAPIIMASGLYAGTSLPDNGKPMLLLDSSGIAASIGANEELHILAQPVNNVEQDDVKKHQQSALLFVSSDGIKQAIRLSIIDRMEDVAVEKISFVGGKFRALIADQLIEVFGIETIPNSGVIQMLRLSDGSSAVYLAVEQVLDIFSITSEFPPSAYPELHEGIVDAFGESIELLNPYQFFENCAETSNRRSKKPLCFVQCADEDLWEARILKPLLVSSGYEVSFDPKDINRAEIVLHRDVLNEKEISAQDNRVLKLRDSNHGGRETGKSVYRYDRIGLISAIENKLSGAR
jgi:two-component system, chemotaxis family, sensor kinase CheA